MICEKCGLRPGNWKFWSSEDDDEQTHHYCDECSPCKIFALPTQSMRTVFNIEWEEI